MANLIYNKFIENVWRGLVDPDSASYKAMLVTSTYAPLKRVHEDRADVTNEVAAGNGYATGGVAATVTVTLDNANDRLTFQLGAVQWTTAAGQTLTARGLVYYVSTGTAANDFAVGYVDFTTDQIASNGGTFSVAASTLTIPIP
jgi:hypothetical protein